MTKSTDQRETPAARAHHDVVVGRCRILCTFRLVGPDGIQFVGQDVQAGGKAIEKAAKTR